jgi:hypothetical protein
LIEWLNIDPPEKKQDPLPAPDSIASVRLALAARIIEAHGGRIEHDVNSLKVRLPLSK